MGINVGILWEDLWENKKKPLQIIAEDFLSNGINPQIILAY